MIKGKANIVIDGQWGSTGKGKLAGWLALNNDISAAVCDFMPNAGHTFMYDNGEKAIVSQIPTSFVNEDCLLLIGPASAIDIKKLLEEIEKFNVQNRLFIHPNASIIIDEDKQIESESLKRISSTLKGCAASQSRKIMRKAKTAKDYIDLKPFIKDTTSISHDFLKNGKTIIVEGAQGFDLSINHGKEYPYVTSRDITPMAIMNNAGIPYPWLGDIYGSLRTYPIRVGNVFNENGNMIGNSGPYYFDQFELSWEALKIMSGAIDNIEERTTVTNKIRRVFSWSDIQFEKFISICAPTKLFINFINHINYEDYQKKSITELSEKSLEWIKNIQKNLIDINLLLKWNYNVEVSLIGTGPKNSDMIVL